MIILLFEQICGIEIIILVQAQFEYCVQAWRLHSRTDIELIEGVQRSVTKLLILLKDDCYDNRLKKLHSTTIMETRRLRGDMTEVFKMFGMDNVDVKKNF